MIGRDLDLDGKTGAILDQAVKTSGIVDDDPAIFGAALTARIVLVASKRIDDLTRKLPPAQDEKRVSGFWPGGSSSLLETAIDGTDLSGDMKRKLDRMARDNDRRKSHPDYLPAAIVAEMTHAIHANLDIAEKRIETLIAENDLLLRQKDQLIREMAKPVERPSFKVERIDPRPERKIDPEVQKRKDDMVMYAIVAGLCLTVVVGIILVYETIFSGIPWAYNKIFASDTVTQTQTQVVTSAVSSAVAAPAAIKPSFTKAYCERTPGIYQDEKGKIRWCQVPVEQGLKIGALKYFVTTVKRNNGVEEEKTLIPSGIEESTIANRKIKIDMQSSSDWDDCDFQFNEFYKLENGKLIFFCPIKK